MDNDKETSRILHEARRAFIRSCKLYKLIVGDWENYAVYLVTYATKRIPLDITKSHRITKHSFDFSWGYAGSGPAQTALALLLELTTEDFAVAYYQQFKFDLITPLPQDNFSLPMRKVEQWMNTILDSGKTVSRETLQV